MMGYWCSNDGIHYTRNDGEHFENCPDGPLYIRPDGWSQMWDNCPFTKIEKEPNGAYLIYSHCEMLAEGDGHRLGKYFSVHMEYRIAENGQLVVTQIPET
jgi:hypothetical protein